MRSCRASLTSFHLNQMSETTCNGRDADSLLVIKLEDCFLQVSYATVDQLGRFRRSTYTGNKSASEDGEYPQDMDAPEDQSSRSTMATFKPRDAASTAVPAPVAPPPIIWIQANISTPSDSLDDGEPHQQVVALLAFANLGDFDIACLGEIIGRLKLLGQHRILLERIEHLLPRGWYP